MTKKTIKQKVVDKVNNYLKDKYIHIDGPHPMEEYGKEYVTKDNLRIALEFCFEETFNLCNTK
jgi:hypothetical protein